MKTPLRLRLAAVFAAATVTLLLVESLALYGHPPASPEAPVVVAAASAAGR